MTKKGWWIALGGCGVLVFACVAFVGLIIFVVVRHLEIRPVSSASAEQEYTMLRSRFAGQTPLVEIDRDDPGRVEIHRTVEKQASREVRSLHIFAFDSRKNKLVKLDLPFWLLRMQPQSDSVRWSWGSGNLDLDNLQVTVEDLERHGPGLVVDFEGRHGEKVLVWSE